MSDDLLPDLTPSRRAVLTGVLGAGFALAAGPASASTVTTDAVEARARHPHPARANNDAIPEALPAPTRLSGARSHATPMRIAWQTPSEAANAPCSAAA